MKIQEASAEVKAKREEANNKRELAKALMQEAAQLISQKVRKLARIEAEYERQREVKRQEERNAQSKMC